MASLPISPSLPHVSLFNILISPHSKLTELKAQVRAAGSIKVATAPFKEAMSTKGNTKVMVTDKAKAHASLGFIFQNMPPRMYKASSSSLRRKKDANLTSATSLPLAILPAAPDNTTKDKPVAGKDAEITATSGEARAIDPDTFTAEQDALLLKLKGEGTTWAKIGVEIGKTKGQVQGRYKELTKAGEGGAKNVGEQKAAQDAAKDGQVNHQAGVIVGGDEEQKTANNKMQSGKGKKGQKERGVHQKKSAEASIGKEQDIPAVKSDSKKYSAANEGRKINKLKADDLFSIDDLRVLAEEKLKDDDDCWLRLASRLYDRTGKRVHPDQVQNKFERH